MQIINGWTLSFYIRAKFRTSGTLYMELFVATTNSFQLLHFNDRHKGLCFRWCDVIGVLHRVLHLFYMRYSFQINFSQSLIEEIGTKSTILKIMRKKFNKKSLKNRRASRDPTACKMELFLTMNNCFQC